MVVKGRVNNKCKVTSFSHRNDRFESLRVNNAFEDNAPLCHNNPSKANENINQQFCYTSFSGLIRVKD